MFGTVWRMIPIAMLPIQMGEHLASKESKQTEEQAGSKPHPVRAHHVHQRRLKESECEQRTLKWYSQHPAESAGEAAVMLEFWMEGPGQGRAVLHGWMSLTVSLASGYFLSLLKSMFLPSKCVTVLSLYVGKGPWRTL